MELSTVELFVTVFFLLCLVAVARFREQIYTIDKESYNYISSGVAILSAVSLARVHNGLGVFDLIPFVSDPLFFKLLTWIGVMTGSIILVSGVSSWLPLSRAHRKYNRKRIRRLELLKRMEQLIRVETRLQTILTACLDFMVQLCDLPGGAVFTISGENQHCQLLSRSGMQASLVEAPDKIDFDLDQLKSGSSYYSASKIIKSGFSTKDMPEIVLPLIIDDEVKSVFLLWADSLSGIDDETRMNMKIAVDIISGKISSDRLIAESEAYNRSQLWQADIIKVINHRRELQDNYQAVAGYLVDSLPVQVVSFAIKAEGRPVRCLTVGENKSLLSAEKSHPQGGEETHIDYILRTGQSLTLEDVGSKSDPQPDPMLISTNMKFAVAYPLKSGSIVNSVLTVATSKSKHLSSVEIENIEATLPVLQNMVAEELHRVAVSTRDKRAILVRDFMSQIGMSETPKSSVKRAVNVLLAELETSIVRVAMFENDSSSLHSLAVSARASVKVETPDNGHMTLSLMPYHVLVRDTGRMMLINQEDTDRKMSVAEMSQSLCPELKSALLVPIKAGEEVVGIISLAERRSWDRFQFNHSDITFVVSIATALALAFKLDLHLEQDIKISSDSEEEWQKPVSPLSRSPEPDYYGPNGFEPDESGPDSSGRFRENNVTS